MIKIQRLTKSYEGQTVLHQIDLEAHVGEMIGVAGSSGSGKSLLLKCMALMEHWDDGAFVFDGKTANPNGFWDKFMLRKHIAYLPREANLSLNKTAVKNVLKGTFYQSALWRKLVRKASLPEYMNAMDYLEKYGLLHLAHREVGKMSGGERQRVAIAKAIVQGAKAIVADDPAAGLDPHSSEAIMQDLRRLCDESGVTVIFTVPQMDLMQRYATRMIGLENGRVRFDVTGRRLTSHERTQIGI